MIPFATSGRGRIPTHVVHESNRNTNTHPFCEASQLCSGRHIPRYVNAQDLRAECIRVPTPDAGREGREIRCLEPFPFQWEMRGDERNSVACLLTLTEGPRMYLLLRISWPLTRYSRLLRVT